MWFLVFSRPCGQSHFVKIAIALLLYCNYHIRKHTDMADGSNMLKNNTKYSDDLFPDLTKQEVVQRGHYPNLHRAINSAVVWHNGQDRKYSGLPYIIHPMAVMEIVRTVSNDEDMLIAAVFHDVLEDTLVERSTIRMLYGDRVTELVIGLSDISKPEDGNRAARKLIDREHLASAHPDIQTIKYADIIHNTADIAANDPNFARVYIREIAALLEVMDKGDSSLYVRALDGVQAFENQRLQEALK